MDNKEKPSIVIVDPDESVLEHFKNVSEKDMIRFLTATERTAAQLIIADKKNFIAGVIIDSKICEPYGIPLIRFVKQHRPSTPLYLTLNEKDKEPEPDVLKGLHISGILRKPLDRQDVTSKVFPYTYFDIDKALDLAKNDSVALDTDVSVEDNKMHPILAKDFLCGSQSFFDVFVQLSTGRYIKILKAGDAFDSARVKSYLEKGVQYFYIKSEAQEVFLQYCDSLTGILLHKKETPIDLKVNQVMNYGKETADFLKQRGFNEATLLTAKQFVTHSENLVKQLKPEKSPILRKFLSNIALCEHGTAITMMAGLMLETMEFKDEKVMNTLALAAFMHDIGLVNMPEKFTEEDESQFNVEEMKQYITHPIVGYEMARNIRMINPIVPATILEHHERRTGQGFPYCKGSGMISTVSEVIGITDTFVQSMKKGAKNPSFNLVKHMQAVYNEFSFPVMDAFDKTFIRPLTG